MDSFATNNDVDASMPQQQQQQQQRSSKRRAEEIFSSPATAAALKLETDQTFPYEDLKGVSSRDFGIEGLEVSDFEQIHRVPSAGTLNTAATNTTYNNNSNNININNSYFCIGSGSGCVDRSVSQTCLTRELDQLPLNHREHVGQDLYGLAEECIPKVDELMLEELEKAIVALLGKAESKQQLQQQKQQQEQEQVEQSPPTMKRTSSLPISNSAPELQALVPYHAYKLALSRNPNYVKDPEFRLMFLRATEGDTKKAAKRLTRHFKTKLRLFGEDKLGRDIVLDDLSDDDMEALKSGGFQVLKKRDAAGRSVLFGRYTSMKYKHIDNMLRALWYIWMTILEDPVNQMKGVVAVGYEVGRVPLDKFNDTIDDAFGFEMDDMNGGFDRTLAREIVSVPLSVPARPVGYHLCTDSHQWVGILNMVMVTLCKFIRLRMRIHHGTDQECKYALMTHGMPTDCVPVDGCGYLSLTNHLEWIDHRRILDAQKMMKYAI
mmetsp:Transcript_8574/g.21078  ORF Transcript_8574/g.21078 Transcript_8574/m.21078 type:complete len:491 (-) Transcript_8574:216-1688(-)